MEKNYKEYLNQINTFVFDVDGVLTDGSIQISTAGELLRTMNIKDGYALKAAKTAGYTVCVISGGKNATITKQMFSALRDFIDPTIAAISTIIIFISTTLLLVTQYLAAKSSDRLK